MFVQERENKYTVIKVSIGGKSRTGEMEYVRLASRHSTKLQALCGNTTWFGGGYGILRIF